MCRSLATSEAAAVRLGKAQGSHLGLENSPSTCGSPARERADPLLALIKSPRSGSPRAPVLGPAVSVPCFPPRASALPQRRSPSRQPLLAPHPYLFPGNARQRRSPEHLATAIVTGGAFSQRHAARPPPGSDHRHFLFRGARRARRRTDSPDVEEVVQGQGQQASRAPDQARQQRPERGRQRPEAGERHPPHQAGEEQHQDAVARADAGGERQQPHAAQHQAQAAGRRRRLPAQPRPPVPRRQVAQVAAGGQRQQPPGARGASARAPLRALQEAGEEEEGTGDAEERAEAERAGAQQRPQPGRHGRPALGPRAQQRGQDKGGQGAEREACPGAERGRRRLHVAEAAEVEKEAARGVRPQRAHAALHVTVAQALGGRGGRGGGRRRRRWGPHGRRVPFALVLPHGPGPRGAADARRPRALHVPGAPSFAERSGLRLPPPPPGLPCARAEGRRRPPHAGGGEWREGLLCVPGRRGRLLFFFPPLKTPARDGRRRRLLHAPARCSSYLTAAAWSVGRASGRSSPAAAPAGCAPRPRSRALSRLCRSPLGRPPPPSGCAAGTPRGSARPRPGRSLPRGPVPRPRVRLRDWNPLGERARVPERGTPPP